MNYWKIVVDGYGEITGEGDSYVADPHIQDHYLFYESYNRKKGVIRCRDLRTNEDHVVLEEDFHLSYPCVFGNYMVPEAGASSELRLYKAVGYPWTWELDDVIAECGPYADPQEYNGEIYVTVGTDDNLCRYNLEGRLLEQTKEKHARSAGGLFQLGSMLIRPVQNNDERYGGGIIFKHGDTEMWRMDPPEGYTGVHTFNFNEHYTVYDLKYEA